VAKEYVECVEVVGKTIKTLKLYEHAIDGCETLIEFTDGTSFCSSVCHQATMKASLYRGGIGTPDVIREYPV